MQEFDRRERVLGLDVLRSMAILLVVASHYLNNMAFWYGVTTGPRVSFSGDLGVDMFFALSGFLIGRIVLDIVSRSPTKRDLIVFLVRRWMRTVPAYLMWLVVITVCFPPATDPVRNLVQFATFTQNLFQPMPPGYWFAVSWSLTIEEWFYLLFGCGAIVTVALVHRREAIWATLAILLVGPLLLRLSTPAKHFIDAGYIKMVPFRLDEIGYGVVFAWLYARRSWIFRTRSPIPWMVGLGLIAEAWLELLPAPQSLFVAVRNDLAVVGCALCIPVAMRVRTAPTWLDAAARYTSRLSYSIYLVHETVLVDVAQGLWWYKRISSFEAILISVIGALVLAELMSRLVEQPLMRRRPRQFPATARRPQSNVESALRGS